MKKIVDIEKLVAWALRDEMPKGRPVSDDIGRVIASRHRRKAFSIAMGARPDIDSLGFVPGAPHEDAERIADAVARLGTAAHLADVDDVRVLFGEWLPIASDAVAAVGASTFNPQSIVVRAGTSGRRPSWQFDQPVPYQRFAPTSGRPRALVYGFDHDGVLVEMVQNHGRALKRDGLYTQSLSPRSPLQWGSPSMIAVGEARAEYVLWRAALVDLARDLSGALAEYEPGAPAAAALPWLVADPVSRVLASVVHLAGDAALPLAPRREPAQRFVRRKIFSEMSALERAAAVA